jgi:hypothetical protein
MNMNRFGISTPSALRRRVWVLLVLAGLGASIGFAQSTSSEILGTVTDPSGSAVADAKVEAKSLRTGIANATATDVEGRFRIRQLPPDDYSVTVEKGGFSTYVQGPITLRLNQSAELNVRLAVSALSETITVQANAAMVNTTNAEVAVNFESRRVSELPLSIDRNINNLALSVPGVSQLSSGQTGFTSGGPNFSVNGNRLRSNNFMIDGQDANDPSVAGNQQVINNPDIVAEFRVITNQFLAEYGRNSGSIISIVTKSGTNQLHGSAFWFYNGNKLNTLSNQDVSAGYKAVPWRVENQFGGTAGGPVIKNRAFMFGSLQKWTIRSIGTGTTLSGAPTDAGRTILTQVGASRPQVKALLDYLPAAQTPIGRSAPLVAGGNTYQIPLGSITGSTSFAENNWQGSGRGDIRFNDKHYLSMRYMVNDDLYSGSGQATPPGNTTTGASRAQSATMAWNGALSPSVFSELRASYMRLNTLTNATDPRSEAIPSLEVSELGMVGINAASSRTAIGLAVNLPQWRRTNTYQLQSATGITRGPHALKFGFDFRRTDTVTFFGPTSRGSLAYDTMQRLYDDVATAATINATLPGGTVIWPFLNYDYFFFIQDEWRATKSLTLTYGLRYETPGQTINSLVPINNRVILAAGGDPSYRMMVIPPRDLNNLAPRFGVNYNFGQGKGILRWLTGNQLVARAGYARSYDSSFNNLPLNVASAFPFLNSVNFLQGATAPDAYSRVQNARSQGVPANPATANRTILDPNYRSSVVEQFSFQLQRELAPDYALTVGWIANKGTGLYQTVDANPIIPFSSPARRVNTYMGTLRNRCNCAASIYHSLQVSLEKRLSKSFSAGAHYTWSAFIDDASELFNPNALSDVAVSQNSFDRRSDRGRSSFDRPHRFTMNAVYEVPFMREQSNWYGKIVGGWQVSPFLTFQAGAPFTVLNGADPGGVLAGISGMVGSAIRPNLNTSLDLSHMNLADVYIAQQAARTAGNPLWRQVTAAAPWGNSGRNILRADGIGNLDLGLMKNTQINERIRLQFRCDIFNTTNTRNFGTPDGRVNSAGFLNQWNTDGGRRRVQLSARIAF